MSAPPGRVRLYLKLGRVSNLPTVWTNVLAGIALGGGIFAPLPAIALGLGASSAYVGGMFLNDAFDRDIDARERPERPIPSGAIDAREVFAVGFTLLGVAVAIIVLVALAVAPWRAVHAAVAALVLAACIVLYDAWHKQNPLSTVIMGFCRGAVYAAAALASGGSLRLPLITGAVALILYVVGLTAVARQENRRRFSSSSCRPSPWRSPEISSPPAGSRSRCSSSGRGARPCPSTAAAT
jgi:4-hydroxybenzoate polyprenyltransferase